MRKWTDNLFNHHATFKNNDKSTVNEIKWIIYSFPLWILLFFFLKQCDKGNKPKSNAIKKMKMKMRKRERESERVKCKINK